MFNALDFMILVTFLGIIGFGFFNGITRVTAAIVSIYFGAVFAAAFYRPVSDEIRQHLTSIGRETGHLVFFMVLFFFFSAVFTMVVARWLSGLQLPRRIEILDNVTGAALGVVVSLLAMTLAAMLLTIILQALNQTIVFSGRDFVLGFVRGQINGSVFVPIFLKLAPFFSTLLEPWFPGGLPPILSGVQ